MNLILKNGKINPKVSRIHKKQIEELYQSMGINVVWFKSNPEDPNDYSQLPILISRILDFIDFKIKDLGNDKN